MVLTVGHIRKLLSKYSDDTLIVDDFGDGWECLEPVDIRSLAVKRVSLKHEIDTNIYFGKCPRDKKAIMFDLFPISSDDYEVKR